MSSARSCATTSLWHLVILHNVEQMTRVLATLRSERRDVSPEVLAGLSPYRTSHINRFGDYTLDLTREVALIDFSRRIHEPVMA